MSSPPPPDADNPEWVLQERAREEERNRAAVGPLAGVNRYRLIARVLHESLANTPRANFAAAAVAAVAAAEGRSKALARQRAVLTGIGAAYLGAMAAAAFLFRTDLGSTVEALGGPIILLAVCVILSHAAYRSAALIRIARSPPGARG